MYVDIEKSEDILSENTYLTYPLFALNTPFFPFKKGDKSQCTNFRGIVLMSIPSKLYERWLEQRLKEEIGNLVIGKLNK